MHLEHTIWEFLIFCLVILLLQVFVIGADTDDCDGSVDGSGAVSVPDGAVDVDDGGDDTGCGAGGCGDGSVSVPDGAVDVDDADISNII